MENFDYFNKNQANEILSIRAGERKLGEKLQYINSKETNLSLSELFKALKEIPAKYIIFGVNEFIGVQANLGTSGEKHTWQLFLKNFLNIQHNKFLKGSNMTVLGSFNYQKYEAEALLLNPSNKSDLQRLREIVNEIDKDIVYLNTLIYQAGKKAIIIGGGHNNAYGNIKGLALAMGKNVNVVNFDAHTDFRSMEGRHSGNGFSYAFQEGFVDNYYIFGAHENYLSKYMLKQFKEHRQKIHLNTFEELKVRFEKDFISTV